MFDEVGCTPSLLSDFSCKLLIFYVQNLNIFAGHADKLETVDHSACKNDGL